MSNATQEDLGSATRVQRQRTGGLILSRKKGESIQVGDVSFKIVSIIAGAVRVRIVAPEEIRISRVDKIVDASTEPTDHGSPTPV